jgi:tetratricopeptide (TPR) repeat protein
MMVLGMFGVIAALALIAGPELAREFGYSHNRTVKLEVALSSLPMLLQAPAIGFGRGAFSAAFVRELGPSKRFYYPENIVVQWAAEWGVVFALLLLALVVLCIARGFRSARTLPQVGALTGLVAIGVHDLADFSLEMSGVAVVAAAMMGAAADSPRMRPAVSLRGLCLGVSLMAFVGAALAASLHERDIPTLERDIRGALEMQEYSRVRELVDDGLRVHPAEPIFALAGAEVAVRQRAPKAAHWLNRSQQLAPLWSAPHLLAARWLFQTNRHDQGLIELRQAEAKNRGSTRATICAILRETDNAEIAFRAAPEGRAGLDFLDRTSGCLAPSSSASAAIDAALRERDSQLVGPTVRQAKRLLHAGDTAGAVEILGALKEPDTEASRTLAMAQLRTDDAKAAELTIARLLGSSQASSAVLHTALSIYVALGKDQEANRMAARLRAQKPDPKSLAELGLRLGRLYEAEGRYPLALQAYEDANDALESPATLSSIARLARELGHRERALLAYRKLCRSEGGKGSSCSTAQDLTRGITVAP